MAIPRCEVLPGNHYLVLHVHDPHLEKTDAAIPKMVVHILHYSNGILLRVRVLLT